MGLEVGMIVEGKVTGITKFGAFVELEGGKTGMVHISEVAPTYVNDIKEHLKEGQTVKVKVLTISEEGKISLSIKKALPQQSVQRKNDFKQNRNNNSQQSRPSSRPSNNEWQPKKSAEPTSFEDMLSRFKQASDEKMSDLKKMNESKRGYSRRNNSPKQ